MLRQSPSKALYHHRVDEGDRLAEHDDFQKEFLLLLLRHIRADTLEKQIHVSIHFAIIEGIGKRFDEDPEAVHPLNDLLFSALDGLRAIEEEAKGCDDVIAIVDRILLLIGVFVEIELRKRFIEGLQKIIEGLFVAYLLF